MPVVRPVDVISFSSEDPNNPASNLLSPDTFRKWRKCKESVEDTEFVILKFEKAVSFLAINFGNEFSAFVEIFVARSGKPDPEFHSFVSQTALMSATESRNGETGNRVKMLTVDKFNKKLASEKWDLVKIVCTQQFNTHIQFGLAYIEFVTPGDPNEKPKVGGFSMLPKALGEDELSGSTSSGRLFAQRLQQKSGSSPNNNNTTKTNSPNSAAATIRQTSLSIANAAIASCEERVKELKKRKLGSKSTDDEEADDDDNKGKMQESESESESDSQSKKSTNKTNGSSSSPAVAKPAKKYKRVYSKDDDDDDDEEDESNGSSRSRVKPGSSKVSKSAVSSKKTKKTQTKPFNKLFEDVIFVMSGYVNPKRANIRRKAEKMGAKCKHDWEPDCTHLICAFVNTPKFREVRQSGHGEIVKEDWIEKSYDARIRFPWRRFCLDRNDKGDESEDEIYAEESEEEEEDVHQAGPSSSQKQSQETSRADDEGTKRTEKDKSSTRKSQDTKTEQNNDDDDDVVLSPVKKKRKAVESDEEDEDGKPSKSSNNLTEKKETKAKSSKKDDGSDDAYAADTDVENDVNEGDTSDFFNEKVFYLHFDKNVLAAKKKLQKTHIEQIILRHKGKISPDMTEQVEYVVTDSNDWDEHFAEALLVNPNVNIVRLQWVIECERENEMTSTENFLILPESDDQNAVI